MAAVEDGLGSEKEKGGWIFLINWLGPASCCHGGMATSDASAGVAGFGRPVCDDNRLRI